jgi:hypothetical protein
VVVLAAACVPVKPPPPPPPPPAPTQITLTPDDSVLLVTQGTNEDSPPVDVTVENTGASDAQNVQLVVAQTGGGGNIHESARTCPPDGFTLAAGKSCEITLVWSSGLSFSADGQLTVSGDNFDTVTLPIHGLVD